MGRLFSKFAEVVSCFVGSPWAFGLAVLVVLAWFLYGLTYGFTDTVQLYINTGTTIVTFWMVFLIQNTQNREVRALHLKLDELIRSVNKARDQFIGLEHMTDDELKELGRQFERVRSERSGHEKRG